MPTVTTSDRATFEEQLGAVAERVLDGIVVEVLIHVVAAVMSTAERLGLNGPGIFHPTAFIDVVDQEIAIASAAAPQEGMKPLDLPDQLARLVGGLFRSRFLRRFSRHAIRPEHGQIADCAVLDSFMKFATRAAVPAHQADANLLILLHRFLGK